MPDTYASVSHLMLVERNHVAIHAVVTKRSRIAIVAPHAGKIEPVTGVLARAIAADDHRIYCFAGLASSDNLRLHVTSTRFAEARLKHVLDGALTVVTIHGCRGPESPMTLVGGLNRALGEQVLRDLGEAGFMDVMRSPRSPVGTRTISPIAHSPEEFNSKSHERSETRSRSSAFASKERIRLRARVASVATYKRSVER